MAKLSLKKETEEIKEVTGTRTINNSIIIDAMMSNFFEAIWKAVLLYFTLSWALMFLFIGGDSPSFGFMFFMWIAESVIEIIFSSQSIEFVKDKVEYVNKIGLSLSKSVSHIWNEYGVFACFPIVYAEEVLDDLGLISLKKKILKPYHKLKKHIEGNDDF